jgi:hypothetical protein
MMWYLDEFNRTFVVGGVLRRVRPQDVRAFLEYVVKKESERNFSLGKTEGFLLGYKEAVENSSTGKRNRAEHTRRNDAGAGGDIDSV